MSLPPAVCVCPHRHTTRSRACVYIYLLMSFPGQLVVSLLPLSSGPHFQFFDAQNSSLIYARIAWPVGTIFLDGTVGAHQGIWLMAEGRTEFVTEAL